MKTTIDRLRTLVQEALYGPSSFSAEDVYHEAGLTPKEAELVRRAVDSGDPDYEFCDSTAYDKLLDYFADEMPYGTQKGRTGEPDVWILDRLFDL